MFAREYRAASEIRWTAIDSKARRNVKMGLYFLLFKRCQLCQPVTTDNTRVKN